MIRSVLWNKNNFFKIKQFLKIIFKYYLFISLVRNNFINYLYKTYCLLYHLSIIKKFYYIKGRNRCYMSGRVHNVLSIFKMSRFFLRYNAYQSLLPGVSRTSK